jgi:hypothetical protein
MGGLNLDAVAASQSGSREEPKEAKNGSRADLSRIPIAVPSGIVLMNYDQYRRYTKGMKHLPVLSRSYVFGHTIPMPQTDKHGHIRLSKTRESEASAPDDKPGDEQRGHSPPRVSVPGNE